MRIRPIFLDLISKSPSKKDQNTIKPINNKKTALIIVDVQDKLINGIINIDSIIFNIKRISDACEILEVPKLITEQNPNKLGKTVKRLMESNESFNVSKMSFSCAGCKELIKELKHLKTENILISGIETHVCVIQSALDFQRLGFNVQVIADAAMSRRVTDHEIAINRMIHSGITVTSTEMAIFDLCKTASHPRFKEISRIIKRIND